MIIKEKKRKQKQKQKQTKTKKQLTFCVLDAEKKFWAYKGGPFLVI